MIELSNELSREIIGAAIEVHRETGPGLLESAYESCLCREMALRGLSFERRKEVALEYKGIQVSSGYRLDILVNGLVIVEIKSVERLEPVHSLQLSTYLKLSDLWLGLLINFNDTTIKSGLKRVVQG